MSRMAFSPPLELGWQPIGQTSNQLILYHPPSHALSVQPHPPPDHHPLDGPSIPSKPRPLLLPYRSGTETPIETIGRPTCPYCHQLLPGTVASQETREFPLPRIGDLRHVEASSSRTREGSRYFRILERAHEGSRPPSPRLREKSPSLTPQPAERVYRSNGVREEEEAAEEAEPSTKGYYERFFREEGRLGIGAEGSVYLATHIIGGNVLGTYAVKKIAVGSSQPYLVKMLREVRLLESLRHPNIIPYHHAWIEPTKFSSFAPPINALHVLMMYATAGNLDTFLLTRSHSTQPARPDLSAGDIADSESLGQLPKDERIKAFKKRRQKTGKGAVKAEETRGVMMLNLEEIAHLFGDIVEGLAFLHTNSILHLDLKCCNVLLHWEEGKLIPKAMISDFGTSEEMLRGKRERTGHTGTMEYMAPETLVVDACGNYRPSDSHADMWSLGMILHKLLFLHLPYSQTDDFGDLQTEIVAYPGFIPSADLISACKRRHIPRELLLLLSGLVNVIPESRPSAERVRSALTGLDTSLPANGLGGLVTKFTRPFVAPPSSLKPREEAWPDLSPVRPILALPSPTIEPSSSLPMVEPPEQSLISRNIPSITLTLKIISLQPQVTRIDLDTSLVVVLIIIAIVAFRLRNTKVELASATFHLFVVWWAMSLVPPSGDPAPGTPLPLLNDHQDL